MTELWGYLFSKIHVKEEQVGYAEIIRRNAQTSATYYRASRGTD